MSKIKRIQQLKKLYGVDDSEALILAMRRDIKSILRLQKHEDNRTRTADLGYSRIGSDNWK